MLAWYDDQRPEETMVFERMVTESTASADTADWQYQTFEESGIALKLPADFQEGEEPAIPVIHNFSNDDVVLQVQVMLDEFSDRDALMEFFNNQEYIVRASQLELNNVELVYAEGSDEDASIYAVIGPDGVAYEFVFIPQNEHGEAVIQAITETICPVDQIPEA